MYKLVIQDDEGKTTVVPLIRDELTIGRKEGNTIRLTERNVSRRHARVVRKNGVIEIEDLDSYNGIRVNGSRIQGKVDLKESDRVQIGDYLIEIKTEAAEKDTSNDATQPIERVDPMGNTPVPEVAQGTMPGVNPDALDAPPATTPVPAAPEVPVPAAEAVAATTPSPAPGQVGHARLVVLSTNYAGREFELDKPAMVIGRTDDNDIWLNHRSISRHHAKIVRENGRYAIVDLQSSNGVRVNGEEYGKVELRRADVVDLGHVRMRFVEPGEDFVFGRDAQAIDIEPEGGGRLALWAVLALLLLGGGVAVFMMMKNGGQNGKNDDDQEAVAKKDDAQDKKVELVTDDADAAPEVVEPTSNDEVAGLLAEARELISSEDWAKAHEKASAAIAIEPNNKDAQQLKAQAKSELDARDTYDSFVKCKADPKCVAEKFAELPEESVYRDRALKKHDEIRSNYVTRMRRAAAKAARRKDCKEVDRIRQQVTNIWPDQGFSMACTAAAAKNPDSGDTNPNPPPDNPDTDTKKDDKKDRDKKYDAYLKDAREAATSSQFGRAIRLCEKALAIKRTSEATMVCAIASCNLASKSKAKRYISRIRSNGRRNMIRQICLRNGVTLD